MRPTILGSETEFGIIPRQGQWPFSAEDQRIRFFLRHLNEALNPIRLCLDVKNLIKSVNWWGEEIKKPEARDEVLESLDVLRKLGISGSYAGNGARIYVDCFHPEYSTPECSSPFEALLYERAGEIVMRTIVGELEKSLGVKVDLLKRNWDYRKASYACHENYLTSRWLFNELTEGFSFFRSLSIIKAIWIFHLVSRQIFTGAGRFDPQKYWPLCFSLSPRQPFIKHLAAEPTTEARAIINLRDRPYADPHKWGRLHVICGDSNRSDWSNLLKYGTSLLVLLMLEDMKSRPVRNPERYRLSGDLVDVFQSIEGPDSVISTKGGLTRALDAQYLLLSDVREWYEWFKDQGPEIDWVRRMLDFWQEGLDVCGRAPDLLARRFDYFIKRRLFEDAFASGKSPTALHSLDYNYHIVGRGSLLDYLIQSDRIETLVNSEEISKATIEPPQTRAALRAKIQNILGDSCLMEGWHFIHTRDCHEINLLEPFLEPMTQEKLTAKAERLILAGGGQC